MHELGFDPKAIVAACHERGLCATKPAPAAPDAPPVSRERTKVEWRQWYLTRTRKFFAQGLNWQGQPRRNHARPELSRFKHNPRLYLRKWRELMRAKPQHP